MDKTAFLLLLVLSNIVPLLALGSMAQRRPRKIQPARTQERALVQAPTDCNGRIPKSCHYPKMCNCPKPEERYMDSAEEHWYYDNVTGNCHQTTSRLGCNNFYEKKTCLWYCNKVEWRKEYPGELM
uniref:Putative monolaris n=1 Tax=Rhipicephalus pulchellus TaxID=72859 RepID=L7M9R6_RHIPC